MANASPAPFDSVAASYDEEFTRAPLARLLRETVWERADSQFRAGMRVLELGCGTGEDAIHFAQQGLSVYATDLSPAMLAVTRKKVEAASVAGRITTSILDLRATHTGNALPADVSQPSCAARLDEQAHYDGVFSNFGVLNCVMDIQPLVDALRRWTRPGAPLVLVVMGPLCIWEVVWYLVHLQPGRAARRWRRRGTLARIGSLDLRVHYPSAPALTRAFGSAFRHVRTTGLGVFLPPPYVGKPAAGTKAPMRGAIPGGDLPDERRTPRWMAAAALLDRGLAGSFPFNQFGDHYILELERR